MRNVQHLVEVRLKTRDDFKIVVETLTRIGICPRDGNILYQLCYLLHKKGRYYVAHWLELEALDGTPSEPLRELDIARRNSIIQLLVDWKLVEVVDPEKIAAPRVAIKSLKVLKHSEKKNWTLEPKYHIGRKYKQSEEARSHA